MPEAIFRELASWVMDLERSHTALLYLSYKCPFVRLDSVYVTGSGRHQLDVGGGSMFKARIASPQGDRILLDTITHQWTPPCSTANNPRQSSIPSKAHV